MIEGSRQEMAWIMRTCERSAGHASSCAVILSDLFFSLTLMISLEPKAKETMQMWLARYLLAATFSS